MLYQTHHHPSFFPFTHCSSSSASPVSFPFLQEMECVKGALKRSSLGPEMCFKATPPRPQESLDAEFCSSSVHTEASVDEFFVDDLLDFSNVDDERGEDERDGESHGDRNNDSRVCVAGVSVSPQIELSENGDGDVTAVDELTVLADGDLENLEWLSHFVEESFSESYTAVPNFSHKNAIDDSMTKHNPQSNVSFPAKARSKRSRNGSGAWSSHSASESSSISSPSSSTSSSPTALAAAYTQILNIVTESSSGAKKRGRKPINAESSDAAAALGSVRRCTHCGVQKTPQWRTGPQGAKTLCNACGVRFKSGRLLPEYRPACSPTFSSDLHSNSHRKVLEMRRKIEGEAAHAVQSF